MVSPAVGSKFAMSATYRRLPSSLTFMPWATHFVPTHRMAGSDGLLMSSAVIVCPPVELTQNVLPSGEKVPSWPRIPSGVLDLGIGCRQYWPPSKMSPQPTVRIG